MSKTSTWTRTATPLLLENELSIRDPWWKLEKILLQEARSQRINRLAQRLHHQHLIAGLDWHVYHQQIKKLPAEHKTHLKTWVQGAVQFRENGQPKQCQSASFGCVSGTKARCTNPKAWRMAGPAEILAPHQHQGWACTLDATPVSYTHLTLPTKLEV